MCINILFQDYKDHIEEISNKLVTIMENMIEAQLTKVINRVQFLSSLDVETIVESCKSQLSNVLGFKQIQEIGSRDIFPAL